MSSVERTTRIIDVEKIIFQSLRFTAFIGSWVDDKGNVIQPAGYPYVAFDQIYVRAGHSYLVIGRDEPNHKPNNPRHANGRFVVNKAEYIKRESDVSEYEFVREAMLSGEIFGIGKTTCLDLLYKYNELILQVSEDELALHDGIGAGKSKALFQGIKRLRELWRTQETNQSL